MWSDAGEGAYLGKMTFPRYLLPAFALLSSGCATSSGPLSAPSAAEIPALEADHRAAPDDLETGLELTAAYREAGRYDDARSVMEPLLEAHPDDPTLGVMAGLLAEDAGDFAAAGERYDAFLASEATGPLRALVEERREVVRLTELRADARASLAREAELSQATPDPGAVGIFPFVYEGSDPTWEPLELALAELLVTDLSLTGRLRVLERARVQSLLDEMALAETGYVEQSTAARSGRMLGSGHIVQGRFNVDPAQRIDVSAALVEVGPPGTESVDAIGRQDAIDRLFDLEKELALDLHEEMGIQLTPAERAMLDERHTESVQALLAFGRGLAAQDAGDFGAAAEQFGQAASIDPSFSMAVARRDRVARAATATSAAARGRLSGQATRLSRQRAAVQALRAAPASVRQRMLQRLAARQAIIAEVLGQDRIGSTIFLEVSFVRPGGVP